MKTMWVKAGAYGWINAKDVEMESVSEDLYGRDNYTFGYKGEMFTSICCFSWSRPG